MGPKRAAAALAALLVASGAAAGDAVYQVRPAVDVPVTVAGFATLSLPYVLTDALPHRCPCDPAELNGLDRLTWRDHSAPAGVVSDVTLALAVVAPPVVDALRLGFSPTLAADTLVYAETLAINSALFTGAKYAFHRPLPRTYQGEPSLLSSDAGYMSFYSGHVSTVVAALTAAAWTARWRYGEQVWPWVVDGLAGVSVGVERVLAGQHFPTDVIAGAAMGFAVGTVVPWIHRNASDPSVTLSPLPGGLAVTARF
jgi:membrane-associated phospholipid phosphatase